MALNTKNYYLIILVTLCMGACKSNVNRTDDIPEISITSQGMLKNTDVYMKFPDKIRVQDSLMCLLDLHGAEKFFHIYSYPALKFITSFGVSGRGDQEFINTGGFTIDKSSIYTFDSHRTKLCVYSIDSLLQHHTSPIKVINYPSQCAPILSFANTENGFVFVNQSGNERITLVDTLGNIIKKMYELPEKESEILSKYPNYMVSLWDSHISYNSINKIVGIVTKLGNVLEIYNLMDSSSKVIIGKGGKPDVIKKGRSISLGKIDGFSDIQVKTKFIYALYSGADREELSKLWAKGINTPDGGNLIYVFDLEGNVKKKYKLDKYINGFDVHEEEGIIYAITSSDENTISKYSIKHT